MAVLAMSWGGPLVKFSSAPATVISAWRLTFSVIFIALILLLRRKHIAWVRLTARDWMLAIASGVMLALHFWTWISSLSYTSVASSVVLVDMQPIFVAVMSGILLSERATRTQWIGIIIAFAGAVVVGLADATGAEGLSRTALFGDGLAVLGCLFVSGYYVIGRSLRQKLDLWVYIGVVYGIAALVLLLVVAFDPHANLTGYPQKDWLIFAALAAGPMMVGHTSVNYALRYVRAYVANIALLGEPVFATLIAWLMPQIHEVPSPLVIVGAVLIGAGIMLTLVKRNESQ